MTAPTPTRDDKFSFGLWTTGWQAQDQFGSATRPPLELTAHIRRLADLGAWGFTFHDNDVVPSAPPHRAPANHRRSRPSPGGSGDRDGHHRPSPTRLQGRRLHLSDRRAPLRPAQGARQRRPRRRARRDHLHGAGERAPKTAQGSPRRLERYREGLDTVAGYIRTRATTCASASSPSPTSPAATSSCPPSAMRSPSSAARARRHRGHQPQTGHEQMATLNYTRPRPGAVGGKLFHIDLNGQHGRCTTGPGVPATAI